LEVVARFPPYRSGTGNVAWHNARQLERHGHEVFVATLDGPTATPSPGVSVDDRRALLRVGNAGMLPSPRKWPEVDVVHVHLPFLGGGAQAAAWARHNETPLLVTYHQDLVAHGMQAAAFRWYSATSLKRVLGQAQRILVPTLDYANASALSQELIGPRTLELPNGVDLDRFSPGQATVHSANLWPQGRLRLLFVGALDRAHEFKGLPVLLRALKNVPRAHLIVAGSGNLRGVYERLVATLRLEARVTFVGSVPDAELPDLYRAADVLVLPSTTSGEIFGLVAVEAMACGKPVIASNLPGVRTVVSHSVTGELVEPGNPKDVAAAIEALREPSRRLRLGTNGLNKAKSAYDWNKIGVRLHDIVKELGSRA
jgi:glycosyltransferase involved in cell wall biosynthesis